jgi:drug/metabolite transporter (DMT)-like permease
MGSLLALLSALAYSVMYFLIRAGVRRGDLDGGAFVTTTVNVILLGGLVTFLSLAGDPPEWQLTGVAWFALAGLLGSGFGRILLLSGMHRMGPVRSVSIVNTAPVVTIGVAIFLLGERLSGTAIVATLLVMAGIALLGVDAFVTPDPAMRREPAEAPGGTAGLAQVAPSRGRALSPALAGLGFSSLSALAFGLSRVARRVGLTWMPDPLVGAMVGSVTALLTNLATQAGQRRIRSVVVDSIRHPRPLLWLAGVCSTLGLLFFFLALQHAPLAHVAVVSSSETVMTMLISWLLFRRREILSLRVVLAAIAVFGAGVLIALG